MQALHPSIPAFASLALLLVACGAPAARPTARPAGVRDAGPPAAPVAVEPAPPLPVAWSHALEPGSEPVLAPSSGPPELLVVEPGGTRLGPLEPRSGALVWQAAASLGRRWVSLEAGAAVVAATAAGPGQAPEGVALERATGVVRWRRPLAASTRLVVGLVGSGAAVEHACALEPLDALTGAASASRVDGATVELPGGETGPLAATCVALPRLVGASAARAVVLHAPTPRRTVLVALDATHPLGSPLAESPLSSVLRTAGAWGDPEGSLVIARTGDTGFFVGGVEIEAAGVFRWSRAVGVEGECPVRPLLAPVRAVSLGGARALLAQPCDEASLLDAADGRVRFARSLPGAVAVLDGERTAGLWDGDLFAAGGTALVWLDATGAPLARATLPAAGTVDALGDRLLVRTGTELAGLARDGTPLWRGTGPAGRLVATVPPDGDAPELALVLRADAPELVALALPR